MCVLRQGRGACRGSRVHQITPRAGRCHSWQRASCPCCAVPLGWILLHALTCMSSCERRAVARISSVVRLNSSSCRQGGEHAKKTRLAIQHGTLPAVHESKALGNAEGRLLGASLYPAPQAALPCLCSDAPPHLQPAHDHHRQACQVDLNLGALAAHHIRSPLQPQVHLPCRAEGAGGQSGRA